MLTPSKLHLKWGQCVECIAKVAHDLRDQQVIPRRIITVAKGGIVPGGLLLQHFPQALLDVIRVTNYSNDVLRPDGVKIQDPIPPHWSHPSTVVIDDIYDTGGTFEALFRYLPLATFTAMVARKREPNTQFVPFITGCWLKTSAWVVFPWEPATPGCHAPVVTEEE